MIYDALIFHVFLYVDTCRLREGLSEKCQVVCLSAMTKFRNYCDQVESGDITIADLNKLDSNKQLVEKFCKAIGDLTNFLAILNQNLKILHFLDRRRGAYKAIVNWISDISKVKGM